MHPFHPPPLLAMPSNSLLPSLVCRRQRYGMRKSVYPLLYPSHPSLNVNHPLASWTYVFLASLPPLPFATGSHFHFFLHPHESELSHTLRQLTVHVRFQRTHVRRRDIAPSGASSMILERCSNDGGPTPRNALLVPERNDHCPSVGGIAGFQSGLLHARQNECRIGGLERPLL